METAYLRSRTTQLSEHCCRLAVPRSCTQDAEFPVSVLMVIPALLVASLLVAVYDAAMLVSQDAEVPVSVLMVALCNQQCCIIRHCWLPFYDAALLVASHGCFAGSFTRGCRL